MVLATKQELESMFNAERLQWLHWRFYMFASVQLLLAFLSLAVSIGVITLFTAIQHELSSSKDSNLLVTIFIILKHAGEFLNCLFVFGIFGGGMLWVNRKKPDHTTTIRLIYWLFVINQLLIIAQPLIYGIIIDPEGGMYAAGSGGFIFGLFFSHFVAALIIPWTVRESLMPLLPIIVIQSILVIVLANETPDQQIFNIVGFCVVGLPGMFVCWIKNRRFLHSFQFRSYRDAYHHVSREVTQARALHESFFPEPITEGPFHLDYAYQPMAQLGGDYLYARICHTDGQATSILCAVIDVTGHGLTATLTANHLHALLKRQTEHAHIPDPGELLVELNRYMHESFSGLSVFATAICIRLDREDSCITWASAGHPPCFLVDADRCKPVLESTTCMLGVVSPSDFDPGTRKMTRPAEASILAYSDGAFEIPLREGGQLGIAGLTDIIADLSTTEAVVCSVILDRLNSLSNRKQQDDILVVKLNVTEQPR